MATFNELAKRYAQQILEAIDQDGFSKSTKVTASSLYASKTVRGIKTVKRDIDDLVYTKTKERLSESDKRKIIIEIQKELHLPSHSQMELILKAASNDELSDLADEIENIMKGR